MTVCPLIFEPILKPRIWGGRRLETVLHKRLPPASPIGESWELADLEDDCSLVRGGPARGMTLPELMRDWGSALLGPAALFEGRFPILLKFLDAHDALSVQVHPDAETARRLGGRTRVKNEAWYVVHAEPDACIYRGFREGVTREDARDVFMRSDASPDGVAALLNRIPVKPGQCFYLPSGTVHALGAGALVAEVQTPSDITYRLYDWNRIDPDTGCPRPLAVQQALDCASFEPFDPRPEQRSHTASVWTTVARMITCPSFTIERVRMVAGVDQIIPFSQLVVWMVLEGRGRIHDASRTEPLEFGVGDTVVLPADLRDPRLQTDANCLWLEITLPYAKV